MVYFYWISFHVIFFQHVIKFLVGRRSVNTTLPNGTIDVQWPTGMWESSRSPSPFCSMIQKNKRIQGQTNLQQGRKSRWRVCVWCWGRRPSAILSHLSKLTPGTGHKNNNTTTGRADQKHQTKNKPGFCALPCVSTLPYSHPGMSVWSLALSVRTSLTCLILFVYFRYWLEEALTQHPCDPLRLPTKVTQDGQLVWCPWARLFALPFWMAWPLSWTVL